MKFYFFLISIFLGQILTAQKNAATIFELLGVKNENCALKRVASNYRLENDKAAPPNYREEINSNKFFLEMEKYREVIKNHFEKIDFNKSPFKEVETFYQENGNYRLLKKNNEYLLLNRYRKIVYQDFFSFVKKSQSDDYGFNVFYDFNAFNKKEKPNYYNYKGELIFVGKFDFVLQKTDNFFIVQNEHKTGIVNTKGEFLLQPLDGDVYPFLFKGKPYFAVLTNEESYFLEKGKKEKIYIPHNGSPPSVIKDRYWLINGKLYDMQLKKRMFCNFTQNIELVDKKRALFQVNTGDHYLKPIFDLQGNLRLDQEMDFIGFIDKDHSIAKIKKETVQAKYDNPAFKYGIINLNSFKWTITPTYDALIFWDTNFIAFIKDKNKQSIGLMDNKGKTIVEPGKFTTFNITPDKQYFLCVNDTSAFLLDRKLKFIRLKRNYISIETSGYPDFYVAGYKKNGADFADILNKEFIPVLPQSYAAIQYKNNLRLWECRLKNGIYGSGGGDEKIYLNHKFKKIAIDIHDKSYDTFQSLDYISEDRFLCVLPNNEKFIRTKNKTIPVTCSSANYDSIANFYITYKDGRYGILDTNGTVLLPNIFQYIESNEGTANIACVLDNAWDKRVIFGKDGKLLFNYEYEYTSVLQPDFYVVSRNKKFGLVDGANQIILNLYYDYMYSHNGFLEYGYHSAPKQYLPLNKLKYDSQKNNTTE